MLELNQIAFAYQTDSAEPFSFTMEANQGEITAITGPSGAGKSTLFDLIAGFNAPMSGEIKFDGQSFVHKMPADRPLSILFQSENIFEHLRIYDNLKLALPKSQPHSKSKTEIGSALKAVGLEQMEMRLASDLSGGQKQRVALARTLLRNRPIMLLDEPLTALDDEMADQLRDLIIKLTHQNNWTTLWITHSAKDLECANRTYRLDHRKLKETINV